MKKFIIFGIITIGLFYGNIVNCTEIKKTGIELIDLSIEQAYELMLENNNSLKAYNEMIETSKFEKRAALGEFSPKVFMNSTYIHFSDDLNLHTPVSIMGIPFTTTSRIQDKNLFALGGGVVWNVFTGGKLLSNHAAARAKLELTNAKYREIKDTLTVELIKRYYGLCLAQKVAETKNQYLETVAQHLKDAKLLEKEGIISKSERLHAEVVYADANRDYQAALRDISIIEEGLKSLIKSEDVDLKNIKIQPKSLLFMHNDFSIDLEAMKKNTLNNNPQLKQLQEKRNMLTAKYHAKTADYMPTISLFATDILAQSHLSEAVPHAAIGGSVNLMLFDGLKRENNVLAAKHERKMTDYEIEDAKYNLEALVTKQYQELMKHKEKYDSSQQSIEKAQEALRVANLSFKEGYGTSLQVTDAQMMLLKIQTERLNSIYNFDITLVELLKTNGDTNEIFDYIAKKKNI